MRPQEVQSDKADRCQPKASTPPRSWRPFLFPKRDKRKIKTNQRKIQRKNEREESG
jgi:hypothetical protein